MDALKVKATKADAPPATQTEFAKAEETYNDQLTKLKNVIHRIEAQLPELKKHLKELVARHMDYLGKYQQTLSTLNTKL